MIQVRKTPFAIDFVENHPVFELQRWPSANGEQLRVKFKVTYPDGTVVYTPDMIYDYVGNTVTVGTEILKHYFKPAEIPHYQDGFRARVLENNELSFSMLYSDFNNSGRMPQTQSFTLVNGYVEPYRWVNNYPDWTPLSMSRFYNRSGIDIFGQDNNATVYTYRGCEQYLYIRNYGSSAIQLSTTLSVTNRNGIVSTSTPAAYPEFNNPTIPAKSVVRLRVDADAFGNALVYNINDVLQYTLSMSVGGNTIARTFVFKETPYGAKFMLLKNKLNLYESYVVFDEKKELTVSGERTIQDALEMYQVSDTEQIYTARTGLLPSGEISLLDIALRKRGNLLLDGQWADHIAIVPGTWTVIDQREDLIEVEFQYKIVKREARCEGSFEIDSSGNDDLEEGFVIGAHTNIGSDIIIDVRI